MCGRAADREGGDGDQESGRGDEAGDSESEAGEAGQQLRAHLPRSAAQSVPSASGIEWGHSQ